MRGLVEGVAEEVVQMEAVVQREAAWERKWNARRRRRARCWRGDGGCGHGSCLACCWCDGGQKAGGASTCTFVSKVLVRAEEDDVVGGGRE